MNWMGCGRKHFCSRDIPGGVEGKEEPVSIARGRAEVWIETLGIQEHYPLDHDVRSERGIKVIQKRGRTEFHSPTLHWLSLKVLTFPLPLIQSYLSVVTDGSYKQTTIRFRLMYPKWQAREIGIICYCQQYRWRMSLYSILVLQLWLIGLRPTRITVLLFFKSSMQSDRHTYLSQFTSLLVRSKPRCTVTSFHLTNRIHRGWPPHTVAAWSEAWTVFARSNTGVVGSNPTRGLDICVRVFCVCVLFVGSDIATGWSPVQGVLPAVYGIKKLESSQRPTKGCRTIDR
jgi:hypothetical protein